MAAISSTKNTVTYRHEDFFTDPDVAAHYEDFDPHHPQGLAQYEGTDRDAGWVYKRTRSRADTRAIQELIVNPGVNLNAIRKQQDAGKDMTEEWEKATRTSFQGATLERLTVRRYGRYFQLPEDYTMGDFHGDDRVKDAGKLHPLAGKVPPFTPEWQERTDESLMNAVEKHMSKTHGGRDAETDATF